MPNAGSQFEASAAALGYFYQVRYGLYLLLGADDDMVLSVERLDDVAFERGGTPIQLVQTKHHVKSTASLTDMASETWKTLRVWSVAVRDGRVRPTEVILNLVTTGFAPPDSVVRKLYPQATGQRDVEGALARLREVAATSKSETNASAYAAFQELSAEQQRALVASVVVLDSSPSIGDVRELILRELRFVAPPTHVAAFFERLEGWWMHAVVQRLTGATASPISYAELRAFINDLREQFHRDALPIEFRDAVAPAEEELAEDQHMFIRQLRIVMITDPHIRHAISDYYKAFEQRSKWIREELVFWDELHAYEKRLMDEWSRKFHAMKEDLPTGASEEEMCHEGRALYGWVEGETNIPIRSGLTEPYVQRGSYHILANELRVGWHPDFLARLRHLLQRAEATA